MYNSILPNLVVVFLRSLSVNQLKYLSQNLNPGKAFSSILSFLIRGKKLKSNIAVYTYVCDCIQICLDTWGGKTYHLFFFLM